MKGNFFIFSFESQWLKIGFKVCVTLLELKFLDYLGSPKKN